MYREDELYHHGIKGMKWGVRRYQNADGTLTKAGKKRLKNHILNKDNSIALEAYNAKQNALDAAKADPIEKYSATKDFLNKYTKSVLNELKLSSSDEYVDSARKYVQRVQLEQDLKKYPKNQHKDYNIEIDDYSGACAATKKHGDVEVYISLSNHKDGIRRISEDPNKRIAEVEGFLNSDKYKKACDEIKDGFYKDTKGEWFDESKITKKEFLERVKPYYIHYDKDWDVFDICMDDDGIFGGHSLDGTINIDTGKLQYRSMNG